MENQVADTDERTGTVEATAKANTAGRRIAGVAKVVGGSLSFTALALSSAQFYKVSAATLGPGRSCWPSPSSWLVR